MNNIEYLITQQERYRTRFFNIDKKQDKIIQRTSPIDKYILKLENSDYQTIQRQLKLYTHLEILELNDCRLKIIPEIPLSVRVLILDNNFIKQCPVFNLQRLSLKNNLLSNIIVGSVDDLDVSYNKLQSISFTQQVDILKLQANEFTNIRLLEYKSLTLDWFKYTSPPMNETQPYIDILSKQEFECLEFILNFSTQPLVYCLDKAAVAQDLGILRSLSRVMDINQGQDTPLSQAVKSESLFAVRLLLELNADANKGQYQEGCIVNHVLKHGLVALMPSIITSNLQLDSEGNTVLHYLSYCDLDEGMIRSLCKIQFSQNTSQMDPIHFAIMKARLPLLKVLIERYGIHDNYYNTALRCENYPAIHLLMNSQAPFEGTDKSLASRFKWAYKLLTKMEIQELITQINTSQNDYQQNGFIAKLMNCNHIQIEQSYPQKLRQYLMCKTQMTAADKQAFEAQIPITVLDILLTLHFKIARRKLRKELFNMELTRESLYVVPFLDKSKITDKILQYEYFQKQ